MKKICSLFILTLSAVVFAGGNTDQVKFPENYKDGFTHYHTQNRANNKQVADMYANEVAVRSVKSGSMASGSIIVMEVYKTETDEAGKPIAGADGLFKKTKLAAVAVMEKRDNWDASYLATERAGDWGFAIYTPDGKPKENDLECQTCHLPLEGQDYMFSYQELIK